MTASPRSHPRRALATIFAVFLIGLVAMSLTAAAVLLRNDVRRTVAIRSEAQLRQLLLAGAIEANASANSPAPGMSPILPADLRAQGATLHIKTSNPNGALTANVTATLGDRRAGETLQFQRSADGWKLTAIELAPFDAAIPNVKGAGKS